MTSSRSAKTFHYRSLSLRGQTVVFLKVAIGNWMGRHGNYVRFCANGRASPSRQLYFQLCILAGRSWSEELAGLLSIQFTILTLTGRRPVVQPLFRITSSS